MNSRVFRGRMTRPIERTADITARRNTVTSRFSRRSFLEQTGLSVSALWLANAAPSTGRTQGFPKSLGSRFSNGSSKQLTVRQRSPFNAEPELDDLVEKWITPTKYFYVRNHAPVPKIDAGSFTLKVEGLVEKPLRLSLRELQGRFKQKSVVATMTCAGNRRYEHSKVKKVGGVQWQEGAIGNARWGGVRLSEVLKAAGVKPAAKHVWFEGLDAIDRDGGTIPFGGSIPIEKAMADAKSMPGALLCTTMNGEKLPPEHGFPLRTVVPGYIGARSVKWLGKIVVSDRPSPNHYLAGAYKIVTEGDKLEWAEAGPIYTYPLNSVICTPSSGAKLKPGKVRVTGYALPKGRPGRTIEKVEVSADGGKTVIPAKITSAKREYCWVLWSADLPVNAKTTELIVRCHDSAGNTQPRRVPWNMKGYLYNAWHRVPVTVQ